METKTYKKSQKLILLVLAFFLLAGGLHAQTEFPAGNFWALGGGIGMSGYLAEGVPVHLVIDPKLWLSPAFMVGAKLGIHYGFENRDLQPERSDTLSFEGQVFLRWNFLHLGNNPEKTIDLYVQGGIGMLAMYRGNNNPFDDVHQTRGSLVFDAAAGVTIPLSARRYVEPQIFGGYPHLWGVSVTAGYKFPLPNRGYSN